MTEQINEFCNQEKLHGTEGRRGVENLCRLVHAIGYQNYQHMGQFHQDGSYGDLIEFLEDNPGCVENIKEWIADQDSQEWTDNLESYLEKETDDEE